VPDPCQTRARPAPEPGAEGSETPLNGGGTDWNSVASGRNGCVPTDTPTGYPADGARIGRFRIVGKLGQGGMGVVFRAVEENLGREVALKIIAPAVAHDPEFRERFIREARAQASLESSHVVAVYAHGEEDGYLYIASQLIADGDLGRMIKRAGPPPVVDGLDIIEQVASGLADAHEAGLVHRDIKPGNVLIRIRSGSLRAYLADFGIARRVDADHTRVGQVAGTPSYMAPELHRGARASVATDVYALGCLLWVSLTAAVPFTGNTEYEVIQGHMSAPVPQLKGDAAMVHATNRVLRMAMAKDPAQRYPSAAAMRADLQAALRLPPSGQAEPVDPTSVPQTAVRPAAGAAGGAAALAARSGGAPSPYPSARPQPGPTGPPPSGPPTPTGGTPTPHGATPTDGYPGYAPPRGRTRWPIVAGVAGVVVALVVGGGAALVLRGGGDPPSPGPTDDESERAAEIEEFAAQDARDVVDAGHRAMDALDAMAIEARFEGDSGDRLSVDVHLSNSGSCVGTLDYGQGKGTVEFLRVDDRSLLKPDEEFWRNTSGGNSDQIINEVDGRWVDNDGLAASFEPFCDLEEFMGYLEPGPQTEYTNRGLSQVDGYDIVTIREGDDQDSEIYVKADDPHYVTRLQSDEKGYFEFREFDVEPEVELPPESDIFQLKT
jgi:serine/threonine protein kinase